jgi:site-specific recombinase XerD
MAERDFVLVFSREVPRGYSPFRLFDRQGQEVEEVSSFLDAQAARGLSVRSLRAYGYSLLDAWHWLVRTKKPLEELSEADLLEYVRFQQRSEAPAPATVNHRLTALCCLYRFRTGEDLPAQKGALRTQSHPYHSSVASPSGYLYPARRRRGRLRLRNPRRVVVPLKLDEVRRFLESFRSWRDLAITGFMLLSGLRSREVIELELRDLDQEEQEVRVRGKGDKDRPVPYPPDLRRSLRAYLERERPQNAPSSKLFVSLKGRRRGEAMTTAGLRSLFRHHRVASDVAKANPHRWRHTFGSEMVRAGISLPALMKLMGHSDVHTTMRYVELSAAVVREEFERVSKQRDSSSLMLGIAEDES